MIDFLSLAKSRKSTYQFSSRKVKKGDVCSILEAGRWAPSSHNTQNWSFIVVDDKKMIGELLDNAYYGEFHYLPPVIIVVVMEPIYTNKKQLLRGELKRFADTHQYLNVSLPVLNMCLAATSLGVDSFIASLITDEPSRLLNIPKARKAILLVGLGYGMDGAYKRRRERKRIDDVIFYDYYGGKR